MESEDSCSHSEAPQLSDDSGLLITSGSFSSDSASGWPQISLELQESDCDERSLSLCDSADASERMGGIHFNTVRKGPCKVPLAAIEPPLQFQDSPTVTKHQLKYEFTSLDSEELSTDIILKVESVSLQVAVRQASPIYTRQIKCEPLYERRQCLNQRFASPRLLHLSPCRGARPSSRSSLSSRLSSSHNSLVTQLPADDSSFITQAISHDTLSTSRPTDILDVYNVPFDSDIYAVPIDMLHPHANRHKTKKQAKSHRKRAKNVFHAISNSNIAPDRSCKVVKESRINDSKESSKRHSLPGSSGAEHTVTQAVHMTLREARTYLHTLYSGSSGSEGRSAPAAHNNHTKEPTIRLNEIADAKIETNNNRKIKKCNFVSNIKSKKHKELRREAIDDTKMKKQDGKQCKSKSSPVKMLSINLKQTFCNLFRLRRNPPPTESLSSDAEEASAKVLEPPALPVPRRALPPLPPPPHLARRANDEDPITTDFATSIHKVKDYGWYWGPISVEGAEKILSNEPDGSFIVRDSSDDHYIFTLTFKLNGLRHVRIEHEQGNFCFGGCTMFKAQTIVEFIENAVETSRSGRYLFFLNLRPVLGPVRVQLLYPVSRFKRVQSLQHMCRFVILKVVRRDLVGNLPLPRRLLDYLSATHYFSEMLADS